MQFLLFFDTDYIHLGTGFIEETCLQDLRLTEAGMIRILSLADEWQEEGVPTEQKNVSADHQTVEFVHIRTPLGTPGSFAAFYQYAIFKNWRTVLLDTFHFEQWMASSFETTQDAYRGASKTDLLMKK